MVQVSDGFTHRPNRPLPRAPSNSFLRRLINLKIAKPRRGKTSQFTLKRAKMQTSGPVVPNLFYAVSHLSLSAERRGPPPQNNSKRYSVFI